MTGSQPRFTITPQRAPNGSARVTPLPPGFAVWTRFIASTEGVSLDIEVDSRGVPHCRRIDVRAAHGDEITGQALRQVPVAKLTRQAFTAALFKYEPLEEGGEPVGRFISTPPVAREEAYARLAKSARRPRRGAPLTDETLRQVAELYRAAVERGDPPTQTVADAMSVPRSTAARWVAKARERNLLGRSLRGRAGEQKEER